MEANINKMHENARYDPTKRRQVNKEEVLHDLSKELPTLFKSYFKGVKMYNETINTFPLESRIRLDASVLNSRIVQCIQESFPNDWFFGRHKRFVLRKNGFLILVKKLNRHSLPMNVVTKHVNTINNQLALPLFSEDSSFNEPILFFGYQKNSMGEVVSPQIVYIDEEVVKWGITESDILTMEIGNVKSINKRKEINIDVKSDLNDDVKKASNE